MTLLLSLPPRMHPSTLMYTNNGSDFTVGVTVTDSDLGEGGEEALEAS